MALGSVIESVRKSALRDLANLADGELLERYRSRRETAALQALVLKHGPMVWGVCQRTLRNTHDAEDAFQATFLVLVRRASSIASPEIIGNWLYGVAHQTAIKARAKAAKRTFREKQVANMPEPAAPEIECANDVGPLLDQELSRLPAIYRTAIVLCDLEGKTRKAVAGQLGVPEGTIAARLARGRVMLAKRLAHFSPVSSAAALGFVLSQNHASAQVPRALVASTMKLLSTLSASGVGSASAAVVSLAENVTCTMIRAKLKLAAAILVGLGALSSAGSTIYSLVPKTDLTGLNRRRPLEARFASHETSARDPLQGEWVAVACEVDGQQDSQAFSGNRLVFAGDQVTYFSRKGPQEATFQLDTASKPAKIDIEFAEGTTLRGIYEFDGSRLRFCWTKGGNRPTSFDTSKGEFLTFLFTYEKKK